MGSGNSKLAPEVACRLQASSHCNCHWKLLPFYSSRFIVDKKEISQLYAGFVKECPGGRLERSHLQAIFRQFFPFGDPSAFVERLLGLFGGSKGGLEFGDYVNGLSVISRGRVEEKMECK